MSNTNRNLFTVWLLSIAIGLWLLTLAGQQIELVLISIFWSVIAFTILGVLHE